VDPENGIGMALYVADVSEPGRGVNGEIRALALEGNLLEAYRRAVRNKVEYLKAKGVPVHPKTLEVYQRL
jgi:HD superfamily phosphohydrolase YqeK